MYSLWVHGSLSDKLVTKNWLPPTLQAMTTVGHRIPSPVLEYGKDPTAVLLKDDHQPSLSFYVLDQLRRRNQFCDVVIKLESAKLPAHKAVLASSSPYLMKLISTNVESSELLLQDAELDVSALEMLVEFIYTSMLRITEGTVKSLCYGSRLLQLERIERACCKFMMKSLSVKNCIGYLIFAEEHGYINLEQASQEFILSHLVEVAKGAEFQTLPLANLLELLKSKATASCSQRILVASLLLWVKHDLPSRQNKLHKLLASIKFPGAPVDPSRQDQLLEAVLKDQSADAEKIFEKLRVCFKVRHSSADTDEQEKPESDRQHDAKAPKGPEEEEEELSQCPRLPEAVESPPLGAKEKTMENTNTLIFAVGGTTKHSATSSVERYDSSSRGWVSTTPLPRKKSHAVLVTYDQKLHSIGGFNGTKRLSTVDTYDFKTDTWEEGTAMPTARSDFGVAVVGRHAFCIGGFDGVTDISTVEVLDFQSGHWRVGPSLQQARSYVQAAQLNGVIYVIGGLRGSVRLSSVEKLAVGGAGRWSAVAELNIPRSRPGVAALHGRLYAVGGYSGSEHLNSVECYDPQIDRWSLIEQMSVPRNSPAVSIVDGCLFVAGGHDGRKVLRSVEKYDPKKKEWSRATSMQLSRCDFGMATIQSTGSLITATWT